MYLEHFQLREFPFTMIPNPQFYCELNAHREALNTLLFSLRTGEGFIKITGEVGCGKTLLCRMLLNHLDENFITAYIPNPDLDPISLKKAIAQELDIEVPESIDPHRLVNLIYEKLVLWHRQNKRVVIIIDEAQALPSDSLEALRLLTNLETEHSKLLQVVLMGQPELDARLKQAHLRQIEQRISFSYFLPKLNHHEFQRYLYHRLAVAGYTYGLPFTYWARRLLFRSSRGIPRIVNLLCHKAMLVAYGRGSKIVGYKAMMAAIRDTQMARKSLYRRHGLTIGLSIIMIALSSLLLWFYYIHKAHGF